MKKINYRRFMKGIGCLTAMTMFAGMLTGCSGGSKPENTQAAQGETAAKASAESKGSEAASEGGESGASGSINFYYWDDKQSDGVNAIIEMFEKENPDIKVVATQIPSGEYWTKLQTSLPTGTGPDVFWMNRNVPDYISAELVADLTDKIEEAGIDMSVFPQFARDLYSRDGRIYAIPKDYDGIGLFYNKAIFDEMNVEYPKDGMSWEELLDLAQKTTTENHYGFASVNTGNVCYQNFIYSNQGRISAADNAGCQVNEAPAVEAIQFLHDMMYKYQVSPTYSEMQEMSANDMFAAGQIAMMTNGSWKLQSFAEALGDDLGICTMPVSKVPAITVHGVGYCISSKTQNMDACWEFVKFCGTPEAQEATADSAIPAYKGCDQVWAEKYAQYDAAKLLEGAYYEGSLGNPWWDKGFTDANTKLTEAMTNIWAEPEADIQGILDQCKTDIEAITK